MGTISLVFEVLKLFLAKQWQAHLCVCATGKCSRPVL